MTDHNHSESASAGQEHPYIAVVGGTGIGLLLTVPGLPRPGQTVVAGTMTYIDGGKAAGQAIAVARLGAPVRLVSAVGDDVLGDRLYRLLTEENVDLRATYRLAGESTMLAAVQVDAGGENTIVVALNAMSAFGPEQVEEVADVIRGARICLVSLEVPVDSAVRALRIARKAGVTTVLNPAPAPDPNRAEELIALSDIITPNETEAAALVGDDSDGEPVELARALRARGAGAVVMTLGAAGALVIDGDRATRVAAPVVPIEQMVDTTGAGDAFNSALVVALTRGHDLVTAARFGTEGGSRVIQGQGIVPALDKWADFVVPSTDRSGA